jgi:hypothetical protein
MKPKKPKRFSRISGLLRKRQPSQAQQKSLTGAEGSNACPSPRRYTVVHGAYNDLRQEVSCNRHP